MRRGFTLIELMLVVAIVGVIAAMSAYTLSSVSQLGRVNGTAQSLATVLRTTRARAITERCTYVVQINGPDYQVAGPPDVLRKPNGLLVWRKNDCRSVVGAYEPGLAAALQDRLVNDYNLGEFGSELVLPAGIIGEPGNRLNQRSVSISWRGDGTRMVWADNAGNGVSADTGFVGDVGMTVRIHNGTAAPSRVVSVPMAGPAVAP